MQSPRKATTPGICLPHVPASLAREKTEDACIHVQTLQPPVGGNTTHTAHTAKRQSVTEHEAWQVLTATVQLQRLLRTCPILSTRKQRPQPLALVLWSSKSWRFVEWHSRIVRFYVFQLWHCQTYTAGRTYTFGNSVISWVGNPSDHLRSPILPMKKTANFLCMCSLAVALLKQHV